MDPPPEKAARSIREGDWKRPVAAGEPVELRKKPCVVTADDDIGLPWVIAWPLELQVTCVAAVLSAVLFVGDVVLDMSSITLPVKLNLPSETASSMWMSIRTPSLDGLTTTSTFSLGKLAFNAETGIIVKIE